MHERCGTSMIPVPGSATLDGRTPRTTMETQIPDGTISQGLYRTAETAVSPHI